MSRNRHDHHNGRAAGSPRRPDPRLRARERIAAERAARRRAEARRRLVAPVAAVTAVLAIVATLVAVKLTSAPATGSESLAPTAVVSRVTSVPARLLAGAAAGQALTPLLTTRTPGRPLTAMGRKSLAAAGNHR